MVHQEWIILAGYSPGAGRETVSKPVFSVILNEVKYLNLLEIRDSSLRSE